MRIIGGRHRGRRLEGPSEREFRPTSDRAREAVFNILTHWTLTEADDSDSDPSSASGAMSPLENAPVLDAFCGSGAMGLEALSRGAARAAFLDSSRAALDVTRRNATTLGESARCSIMFGDATRPPPCPIRGGCRVAFLDPPYLAATPGAALTALHASGWFASKAIIVLERSGGETNHDFPPEKFALIDERRYGVARILFLTGP
ncbi:16S rRNA (guanine966-N2)-methyltransferase [Azospirillaceae bacterium]